MGVAKYIKNEKDEVQDVILQSGIHVKPLYTQKDLEEIGFDPEKDLALRGSILLPGESTLWVTGAGSGRPGSIPGFGTPQETNERFKTDDLPWPDRPQCCVRSSHPDGSRFG